MFRNTAPLWSVVITSVVPCALLIWGITCGGVRSAVSHVHASIWDCNLILPMLLSIGNYTVAKLIAADKSKQTRPAVDPEHR